MMNTATETTKAKLNPGRQWIGIDNIILDERFQPRHETDFKWMSELTAFRKDGSEFPPARIYQLPDGRLVAASGHHRIPAMRHAGEEQVLCDVVDGTEEDAIVFAAGSNKGNGVKPMGPKDVTKALEMILSIDSWWENSSNLIAEHIGCSATKVHQVRSRVATETGRVVPERIKTGDGNTLWVRGVKSAKSYSIRKCKDKTSKTGYCYRSAVHVMDSSGRTKQRGVYGLTEESARQKIAALLEEDEKQRNTIRSRRSIDNRVVRNSLKHRGFTSLIGHNSKKYPGISGWFRIGSPSLIVVTCDFKGNHQLPRVAGCLERAIVSLDVAAGQLIALGSLSRDPAVRKIILCYPSDGPFWLIDLYKQAGFEFLTPEELIESLK